MGPAGPALGPLSVNKLETETKDLNFECQQHNGS